MCKVLLMGQVGLIANTKLHFFFQSKYTAIAEKYAIMSYYYSIEREHLPKVCYDAVKRVMIMYMLKVYKHRIFTT